MVDGLNMSVGRSTGDHGALVFALATPANGLYSVRHLHGFKLNVVVATYAAALIVAFEARC
jgi:hypothetical protein